MEDKKKEIFEFITNTLGFKQEEDVFKKSQSQVVRQLVVNGRRHDETAEFSYEIQYLGEGYIENLDGSQHESTFGFKFIVNDTDQGDIWARNVQDFSSFISKRQ